MPLPVTLTGQFSCYLRQIQHTAFKSAFGIRTLQGCHPHCLWASAVWSKSSEQVLQNLSSKLPERTEQEAQYVEVCRVAS